MRARHRLILLLIFILAAAAACSSPPSPEPMEPEDGALDQIDLSGDADEGEFDEIDLSMGCRIPTPYSNSKSSTCTT